MLLTPLNYFFSLQLVPVFEWERVDAPDLPPRLVTAGHDQGHDGTERERRVTGQHRAQLVGVAPREHRDAQDDETTQPARHRGDVHHVGRDRRLRDVGGVQRIDAADHQP